MKSPCYLSSTDYFNLGKKKIIRVQLFIKYMPWINFQFTKPQHGNRREKNSRKKMDQPSPFFIILIISVIELLLLRSFTQKLKDSFHHFLLTFSCQYLDTLLVSLENRYSSGFFSPPLFPFPPVPMNQCHHKFQSPLDLEKSWRKIPASSCSAVYSSCCALAQLNLPCKKPPQHRSRQCPTHCCCTAGSQPFLAICKVGQKQAQAITHPNTWDSKRKKITWLENWARLSSC